MTKTQLLAESRALRLFNPMSLATDSSLIEAFAKNRIGYAAIRGVRRLQPAACSSVDLAIVGATAGLLDIDAGKVLLTCWSRFRRVEDAMKLTARTPGRQEVVPLHEHSITSSYHPTVDVLVDRVKVHTFKFDLNVEYTIESLALTIQDGRVAAVRGGRCRVDAKLEHLAVTLKTWTIGLDLGPALTVGHGAVTIPEQPSSGAPRR